MSASDARPLPIYGQQFQITFCIFNASGDLVSGAADLDSQVSKDGGDFVACSGEAAEIGTSGYYRLTLTSGEMTARTVAVRVLTSTPNAKTATAILYPSQDDDFRVNVARIDDNNISVSNFNLAFGGQPNEIDATLLGNVGGSVASVTAGVTLADDAISAAKIADDAITAAAIDNSAVTVLTSGCKLASDGLDLIAVAPPTGIDAEDWTFTQLVVMAGRWHYFRKTKSATQIKTFANNGVTVVTTQNYTAVGADEDIGAA